MLCYFPCHCRMPIISRDRHPHLLPTHWDILLLEHPLVGTFSFRNILFLKHPLLGSFSCSLRRQPPTSRTCQPCSARLHWLPIREQILYKVCLMMFNIVSGTAPTYMTGMVPRISNLPGRCHLRSAVEELFDVPRTRAVFGSRAFSISDPVAWSGLPVHVRVIRDVILFESSLKTHFFQLAYPNSL